ncbi:hypothetical protein KOW79_007051 [Hemibagrus wyckioides]|uniref:Uncharacterized protein n=1 Tax=Hemibagrus wyckioides TaxID=337641 RepID=A0A9D3NXV3_9TELE|nr:hypothetical protein KOW79_007051 [Hemibagrus wyckioides]
MTSCSRVPVTPRAVFVSGAAAQSEGALHFSSIFTSLGCCARTGDKQTNRQTDKQARHHTLLKVLAVSLTFLSKPANFFQLEQLGDKALKKRFAG